MAAYSRTRIEAMRDKVNLGDPVPGDEVLWLIALVDSLRQSLEDEREGLRQFADEGLRPW